MPSINITSGNRKIVVRKLIPSADIPEKKTLMAWLSAKAPSRTEIREGMLSLMRSLEDLVGEK